jgi:hypothetical protein
MLLFRITACLLCCALIIADPRDLTTITIDEIIVGLGTKAFTSVQLVKAYRLVRISIHVHKSICAYKYKNLLSSTIYIDTSFHEYAYFFAYLYLYEYALNEFSFLVMTSELLK